MVDNKGETASAKEPKKAEQVNLGIGLAITSAIAAVSIAALVAENNRKNKSIYHRIANYLESREK
jgi:hypothetical protein